MRTIAKRLATAATVLAIVALTAGLALAAGDEPDRPGYAIPNLCAVVMGAVLVATACKQFRRVE